MNGTNHISNGNMDHTPPTMVPSNTLQQTILTDGIKSPIADNHQDEQTDRDTGINYFL
jgi:hypothetical protein